MRHTPRHLLTTLVAAAMLAGGLLVSAGGPAGAAPIVVTPGQSIQDAVNSAPPGSTIQVQAGTYHESVEITKNTLTIQGAGQGKTILLPPASPPSGQSPVCVEDPSNPTVQGFCIHGKFDSNFNLLQAVQNVRVTGFTVQGFSGTGIIYQGASGAHTDHNTAANNGSYGIAAFVTSGEVHQYETVFGSGEAGLYMGDSPNAKATVTNITTYNNGRGIFIRHTAHGTLQAINAHDNCIGVLFLQQGNGTHDWVLNTSSANHNTKFCPNVSGIGVAIAGADHITVNSSQMNNNRASGPTAFQGGIVMATIKTGEVPHNNTISNNAAYGNHPDILWDGTGTANVFSNNTCNSSQPPGLCK